MMQRAETTAARKSAGKGLSQAEELKILRRVVDLTAEDLDLDKVLKQIVKIVTEFTRADSVFVYLFDEKKRHLILRASKTPHKKELGQVTLKVGEGITGWVARESRPVAIPKNAYVDERFKRFDVLPEDRYEAFLSVPILYRKRVIGVINVQHRQPHRYSTRMVGLIAAIAKQVGGMIEHSRLFSEIRQKAAQFDNLVKVSESITSERYLDEILNLIVVVTAEMLNSSICSIMLVDGKKQDELVIKATQSLSEAYKNKPPLSVRTGISGEVLRTKRPIAVEDVKTDPRYVYKDIARRENLTSMLAVPLVVKDRPIGVVNVYTQEPHHFTDEEVRVLQMVAHQAAVAVENTKLLEEAAKAREALEARKLIERAKGVLMRLHRLNEEDAYRLINKRSMDTGRSMREIAESIILIDELARETQKEAP